jgi:hypothetical protein
MSSRLGLWNLYFVKDDTAMKHALIIQATRPSKKSVGLYRATSTFVTKTEGTGSLLRTISRYGMIMMDEHFDDHVISTLAEAIAEMLRYAPSHLPSRI